MQKEDLSCITEILHGHIEQLMAQADVTRTELRQSEEHLADPIDQANSDSLRAFMLRIRDRESRLHQKILQALQRLEDGTYGICEHCGEEIGMARLKARPVTSYCIRCKTLMENREKRFGR